MLMIDCGGHDCLSWASSAFAESVLDTAKLVIFQPKDDLDNGLHAREPNSCLLWGLEDLIELCNEAVEL
jgi:hypothetical protein